MSESASALDGDIAERSGPKARVLDGVLIAAVVTTAIVAILSVRQDAWLVAALVLLVPPVTAIAIIDARLHRIPNPLVLAALGVAGVTVAGRAFTQPDAAVRAVVAAIVVGLLYLLLWRFADLGLGDVKLTATLALIAGWAGWETVVAFIVLAHVLQVPFAVWRLVRRRRERIAFAPALVVGLYLAVAVTALTR